MIFLKKNTRKYDIFFKLSEKMVFPKIATRGHDLSCIIQKDGIFSPKTYFFPGQEVRDDLSREIHGNMIFSACTYRFYKRGVTSPCQKKSRMVLSGKNTPKGDRRPRLTLQKELQQFSVLSWKKTRKLNIEAGLKFDLLLNLFGLRYSTMNQLQYFVSFSPHELFLEMSLSANKGHYLSIRRWVIIPKM